MEMATLLGRSWVLFNLFWAQKQAFFQVGSDQMRNFLGLKKKLFDPNRRRFFD
jgi:hypothetical protein